MNTTTVLPRSLVVLLAAGALLGCVDDDSSMTSLRAYEPILTQVAAFQLNTGDAHDWWVDAGVELDPGGSARISCLGGIARPWGGHAGLSCAGDGFTWEESIAPACPFGSLVAKVGVDGTPICVGMEAMVPAGDGGQLYVAFNDGVSFIDNDGSWSIEVQAYPALESRFVDAWRPNSGDLQDWWNDTGIDVSTGDQLEFDCAQPDLAFPWGGHPGLSCAGDGFTWEESIAPGCSFGALIGKIGEDGEAFCIGDAGTHEVVGDGGRLYLAFNDGVSFVDNSGGWNVDILRTPAPE